MCCNFKNISWYYGEYKDISASFFGHFIHLLKDSSIVGMYLVLMVHICKYKGTLMIAMDCDGNNQLFPLDFAIIEGENIDSWGWFLTCIRTRVTHRRGLCVISD